MKNKSSQRKKWSAEQKLKAVTGLLQTKPTPCLA
jgi:hypothetical protein